MKAKDFTKEYDARDLWTRQIRITADKEIVRRRKEIVEHPFGTMKRAMDTGYVLLKGMEKVSGEFALSFLAYNMKRAINILGVAQLVQALRA